MTTRAQAETLLFVGLKTRKSTNVDVRQMKNETAELSQRQVVQMDNLNRRRINPMHCPVCASWVDVYLRPVRLCCTGCGAEATL